MNAISVVTIKHSIGSESDGGSASNNRAWRLGSLHSAPQWANQMGKRGWTEAQIDEAIVSGQNFPATNQVNPANKATRYVHPTTGRSVVVDDATGEVIHVGGDGFSYDPA